MDALDGLPAEWPPRDFHDHSGIPIPSAWDERAAALFGEIRSSGDYSRLLDSMTSGRAWWAGHFAFRWAQYAARTNASGLLATAFLAASVPNPLSGRWDLDPATLPVAACIRATQVSHWELERFAVPVGTIVGEQRWVRIERLAALGTPILAVAGLRERFAAEGWELS